MKMKATNIPHEICDLEPQRLQSTKHQMLYNLACVLDPLLPSLQPQAWKATPAVRAAKKPYHCPQYFFFPPGGGQEGVNEAVLTAVLASSLFLICIMQDGCQNLLPHVQNTTTLSSELQQSTLPKSVSGGCCRTKHLCVATTWSWLDRQRY